MINHPAPDGSPVLAALRHIEGASHVDHAGILVSAVLALWGAGALLPKVQASLSPSICADLALRAQHTRIVGAYGQAGARFVFVYRLGRQEPIRFSSDDVARICGSFWPAQYHLTFS